MSQEKGFVTPSSPSSPCWPQMRVFGDLNLGTIETVCFPVWVDAKAEIKKQP